MRAWSSKGFGNVGATAARIAYSLGAKIVGFSDIKSGIYNQSGIDLQQVDDWIADNEYLEGMPGAYAVSNQELLELPCDVLIPAAIQNQITEHNASALKCKVLVEGANGRTPLEADNILADCGIVVVPDILANAGGVSLRTAAMIRGIGRVKEAKRRHGVFP